MDANYFQILEGTIDTVHAGFLHRGAMRAEDQPPGTFAEYLLKDRQPRYAVVDTDGGTCYGAYRHGPPGQYYWRIAQFLLPFYAMAPGGLLGGGPSGVACYVPMDDEHTLTFGLRAGQGRQQEMDRRNRDETTSEAYRRFIARRLAQADSRAASCCPTRPTGTAASGTEANLDNDFLIDRELQRLKEGPDGYTGIATVQTQDQAMTNSMGAIYDRSQEHLGTSDAMIIRSRRRLIECRDGVCRNWQYAADGRSPGVVPRALGQHAPAQGRRLDSGHRAAARGICRASAAGLEPDRRRVAAQLGEGQACSTRRHEDSYWSGVDPDQQQTPRVRPARVHSSGGRRAAGGGALPLAAGVCARSASPAASRRRHRSRRGRGGAAKPTSVFPTFHPATTGPKPDFASTGPQYEDGFTNYPTDNPKVLDEGSARHWAAT